MLGISFVMQWNDLMINVFIITIIDYYYYYWLTDNSTGGAIALNAHLYVVCCIFMFVILNKLYDPKSLILITNIPNKIPKY